MRKIRGYFIALQILTAVLALNINVPAVNAVNLKNGSQYIRQELNKKAVKGIKVKAEDTLEINSLEDGTYTLTGEMLKLDKKSKSMANNAIDHNVTLTVKNGKYKLTVNFLSLTIGSSKGYLSKLKYFKTGYKSEENGTLTGKKAAVTIKTYQTDDTGENISDTYGTDYPLKVTFPMIAEAKSDAYVPLQVFVPIMEAISEGTGTQTVYLKLDLSSITAQKKNSKNSYSKKVVNSSNRSKKNS